MISFSRIHINTPHYFSLIFLSLFFCTSTKENLNDLHKRAYQSVKNNQPEKAYQLYKTIHEYTPKETAIVYNLGYICNLIGEQEEAITWYNKAIALEPDNEKAHLGRAKARLAICDFENGWPEFEYRMADYKTYIKQFTHQDLTPQKLAGKHIFLRAEWGLGDMIQFVLPYAKLLKSIGATVIVQTFDALMSLFASCPYIDQLIPVGKAPYYCDFQIPYLSLPMIFKTDLDSIPASPPYLFANITLIELWKKKLECDQNFKVGLCWHAKPIYLEESPYTKRSIPLQLFEPLSSIDGISFYSLQKIHGIAKLQNLPKQFVIHHFDNDFDESNGRFMDTAALIKNIDLIISADTSIVHVAGSLGAQTWVLLPYNAEWRWQKKEMILRGTHILCGFLDRKNLVTGQLLSKK